jgi:hypothetical protein
MLAGRASSARRDLSALMDALHIERAGLGGYDCGRAALRRRRIVA